MPQHGVQTVKISDANVTLDTNTTGEFSNVIDIQVPHGEQWTFPANKNHGLELLMYTHEQFSQSASSQDTHSLSNNLINSPAVRDIGANGAETSITGPRSLVVWDDDSQQSFQTDVDSVDYGQDQFKYTDSDGNTSNLETFYLWGDSAQVEFRHYDRSEEDYDKVHIDSLRNFHESDPFDVNERVTFDKQFTMDQKEHLKIAIKTDVDLTNWDAFDDGNVYSPNSLDTWSYSYFKFPVIKKSVHSSSASNRGRRRRGR